MTGNKRQSAFAAGMAQAGTKPEVDPKDLNPGGNWSRMAITQMEQRLTETKGELERAEEAHYQGILEGVIPVRVPVDRIIDEIGSDRFAPEEGDDTESLAALIANIRERGLRTPLRVRPRDPDWRPDPATPRDLGDQVFVLQSGRRRLAACREIGLDPVVFLSFVASGDQRLDDLQERFFENATRKNLSTVEKLYSIGLIARETDGTTQAQIADFIGTSVAQVSRGLAVVTHFDRLEKELDLSGVTRDEIDAALKRFRDEQTASPETRRKRAERARKAPNLPFHTKALAQGQARLRVDKEGTRVLTLSGKMLDDDRIARILDLLD